MTRPETRDVAKRVSGRNWVQSTELDIVKGSFCKFMYYVRLFLGWCYITSPLHSADKSQEGQTAVHCCDPTLSVLVTLVSLGFILKLLLSRYAGDYLSLTEFEVRTVGYGPSFFTFDLWLKREARGS